MARSTSGHDLEYGADTKKVRELSNYWQNGYDWHTQEAKINQFDQFTTEIDGQQIYFVHQRSSRPDTIPLMLIHGLSNAFAPGLVMVVFQSALLCADNGCMRTTVDMKPEHRAALLALASRRGQKGLSAVLADVVESYLQGDIDRERRRQTLLSLGGSLSKRHADKLSQTATELRNDWR